MIATGATTNFFGNKKIAHYALGMKSVPEALNIRSYCLQNIEKALLHETKADRYAHLNFVVVGAGPTGVELSGAIAEIRNHILAKDYPELNKKEMHVYLVEGLDRVLANLSPQASEKAALYLKELQVKLKLNTQVTGYDGNVITFADGSCIQTKTVIWSAGVAGQFPEGIDARLVERGNRIRVDEINRIAGMNDVFAIGDVAAMITDELPRGHPGVAPVAQQQGRTLAANLLRLINGEPTVPFRYFDKGSMATIGRNKAVVDIGRIRFQGFFAWWVWMFVHLLSLIGFRNRLVTFINWVLSYITFNGGIRLIIHPYECPPYPEEEAETTAADMITEKQTPVHATEQQRHDPHH